MLKGRKFGCLFVLVMSNNARISSLDGVRGLATVMVLTGHFLFADVYRNQWWFEMAHSGWLGVDLFFVLSGFLITGILLKSKGKPHYFREFYRRRFLRIFPLYYAVIIYAALAILLIDRAPERLWNGYDSLGWFLAFIPNFALAFKNDWLWQTNWAGLNHLWSLAVEEQFYMFWPLIVWAMPRKLLAASCAVLLCVGVVSRQITDHAYGTLWSMGSYVLPFCRMDGLAGGSLLAILLHTKKIKLGGFEQAIIRDITFLCFMGLFYWLVAENSHWRGTIAAFTFVGFTYLALCEEGIVRRICELKFLRHLGMFSYGLYIFHQLLFMVYFWYIRTPLEATGLPMWAVQILYMVIAFGVTYALARLSWKFIEKPFLDLKEKKFRKI